MTPTKDDALAALDDIAAVELIAKWMIHHGFTTGHGDTIEGLLNELSWQIAEIKTEGDDGGHATEQQPAAPTQIDAVDKWEPLKISNGYQYPAQSGEYIVRMIDGAELRSQYDGRFFRRKDNWDKIIPDHEIVCFKAIRAALTQTRETVSTTMDYDLIAPVAHYFNGDAEKTRLWFETPNPNLGGVKPIDTPRDRLLKFITEQTLTQPPVDVEALKIDAREAVYHRHKNIADPDLVQDIVWDCIDYLVSKGCLK